MSYFLILLSPPLGFEVVVIDPPWPVKKITHQKRPNQKTMDYETMSLEDIKNLPIILEEILKETKLNKKTKRKCYALSHYKFRMIMEQQAEKYGVKIKIVNEYNTTKMCSKCNTIKGIRKHIYFTT